MKCNTKRYADGGPTKPVPLTKRPPAPQTEEELDKISPEALQMMEQKRREMQQERQQQKMEKEIPPSPMRKGGKVKKMAKGGKVGSASKRADGCAQRGKTRGRMI